MDEGWKTVAVVREEGGEWIPFEKWQELILEDHCAMVHAIKFANGEIWDAVTGWRPRVEERS